MKQGAIFCISTSAWDSEGDGEEVQLESDGTLLCTVSVL